MYMNPLILVFCLNACEASTKLDIRRVIVHIVLIAIVVILFRLLSRGFLVLSGKIE